MKVLQNNAKIAEIQARLTKYPYLSKASLPGSADAKTFQLLQSIKRYPDRKYNPNFYHWFIIMRQFSTAAMSKWISNQLYYDLDDTLILQFIKLYKKQSNQTIQIQGQSRIGKTQSITQFEYTIDVFINSWIDEKIRQLNKIIELYGAQKQEIIQNQKSKFIRIVCRMDTKKSENMINQISACIEYYNIQIKKKPIKSLTTIQVHQKNHQNN